MPNAFVSILILLACTAFSVADEMPLSEAGVDDRIQQDWGNPHVNQSVEGHQLAIAGTTYATGVGTHAASVWIITTGKRAARFRAAVGMDDEVKNSPEVDKYGIDFKVVGDGKLLFDSKPMHSGEPAVSVDVDLKEITTLTLTVDPTNENMFCHADWVNATITYSGEKPVTASAPMEAGEVLTPKSSASPRINCAKVVGVRPSHPLLFTVAATGDRPMTYSAKGLPNGISLDAQAGQLSGSTALAGESVVELKATNALGSARQQLKIVVGDKIALTPPMGWNSWNCFAGSVSDEKVRAAADAMVSSGLINHGWTYINIDDCWEIPAREPADHRRAADGHVLTNKKFPDMKALADYIHAKGLRAGLYSSPGPATCGNFTASYQHEEDDARQYAAWGFDYLKYDWCSYGNIARQIKSGPNPPSDLEIDQHPYAVMRDALLKQNRDIVFSFCQYGMGNVWQWGEKLGGNCWRTTDDINDSWRSLSGIAFKQNGHEKYAGPGHWNDPDMLVVGKVGWGPRLRSTKLTPNEQYLHITMWSLLSSPLLIGCDMTQMDDFTYGLLSNDEVIAVNQDPLGKPAGRVVDLGNGLEVWARDLQDASKAVGLFNRGELAAAVTVKWSDLGITGPQTIRDLWRQKEVGTQDNAYTTTVNRHGAVLVKITAAGK